MKFYASKIAALIVLSNLGLNRGWTAVLKNARKSIAISASCGYLKQKSSILMCKGNDGIEEGNDDIEMEEMMRVVNKNAPTDFEMRIQTLGITPLTVAGYALAAVLILCNTIFGYGWASSLLGIDNENGSGLGVTIDSFESSRTYNNPSVGSESIEGVSKVNIDTLYLKDSIL